MLPDWTKEGDYPADLPMEGWAWEFLRRNKQYQGSWLNCRNVEARLRAKFGPEESWSPEVRMGTEVWHFDPPINPGESQIDWRRRVRATGIEPRAPETFSRAMAREWRLVEMLDPSRSAMEITPRFIEQRPAIYFYVGGLEDEAYSPPPLSLPLPTRFDIAVVQFDMIRYIRPQTDYVREKLEEKQAALVSTGALSTPSKRAPKPGYYRDILRVFDAYSAKEKDPALENDQIATAIFGKGESSEKAISAMYATAKKYVVDKGYLSLIP